MMPLTSPKEQLYERPFAAPRYAIWVRYLILIPQQDRYVPVRQRCEFFRLAKKPFY